MKYVILERIGDFDVDFGGISMCKTKKEALKVLRMLRMIYKKKAWWVSPIYANCFFRITLKKGESDIVVQIMNTTDFYESQTKLGCEKWKLGYEQYLSQRLTFS